ncbi:plasmid recombination protein [Roseateles oligotrophus]|uniref:Plasmid recombination protein n=1 Tax=Roseateles oligotrophus TaxID=1769250 RepID=A0ABT2YC09_9BURK|nr:plasmid recombination protein [Roseateles oligotrophus]MCV2367430.1 plasmid recombination protein [Roseateles oligotrophus]
MNGLQHTRAAKAAGCILLIDKLNRKEDGDQIVRKSAKHNRREIVAENKAGTKFDPKRSHLNSTIRGPSNADGVAALAKQMMKEAGVTPRKDAVLGIELVFSLSLGHGLEVCQFFTSCTEWAGGYFGGEQNILSSDIHLDEEMPHCHVLILPLKDGKLAASKMVGGIQQLAAMQGRFFEAVGKPYGLTKPTAGPSWVEKSTMADAVLNRMREGGDPAMLSPVWGAIQKGIERDPGPYFLKLGIDPASMLTARKATKPKELDKKFIKIMTGKGRATSEDKRPIERLEPGKAMLYSVTAVEKSNVLSCVESLQKPVIQSQPPAPAKSAPEVCTEQDGWKRERDGDRPASAFDSTTGDFIEAPAKPRRMKDAVLESVDEMLRRTG